ncbi:hypothetical protein AnigIFM63604_003493, partial [Aspergillus niger]
VAPLRLLPISTVSLSGSFIEVTDIDALIGLCRKLAAFYYCQYGSQSIEPLSPQRLYSLLFCQRNSLRVLQVSLYDLIGSSPIFSDLQFGSLKDFVGLEYLILDQVYFNCTPQLPPSLKHLTIRECRSPVAPSLVSIAECVLNGQLPNLQIICLHSDGIFPGKMLNLPQRGATDILFNEACRKLLDIFDGTGITLRFENDLLDKTVQGYGAAYEYGQPGLYWPFIYLE